MSSQRSVEHPFDMFSPRRNQRRRFIVVSLVLSDALALLASGMLATWIRFGSFRSHVSFEASPIEIAFWQLAIIFVPLWLVFMAGAGLYDLDRISRGFGEAGRVSRALSFGVVALILGTYLAKMPGLSRGWTLLLLVISVALVLFFRSLVAAMIAEAHRRGKMLSRALIVGSNAEASDIIRVLQANTDSGIHPIGYLASTATDRLPLDYCQGGIVRFGHARDIVDSVREHRIDTVVIASSAFDHEVVARMIADLRVVDVDLHISSGLFEVLTSRIAVTEIAGVPLITVKGLGMSRLNRIAKRIFDLTVATLVLIVGLPVWIALALAVKFSSSGPILYAQERVGRDGVRFGMKKFRSMYSDADARLRELQEHNEASGPMFKIKNDPRVTPVGRFMRKFSLDEFPQLINVLRGEMSLVGPRPPLPREVDRYSSADWRRLEVVPGMTGLWQVSGRSSLTFDDMVRLDVFYIENWSVALDISLMLRTVPAVVFARGAY